MLVLTRKVRQQIHIGENITITILRMKGQAVRVGIDAPNDVRVVRGELQRKRDDDRLGDGLGEESSQQGHAASSPLLPPSSAAEPVSEAALGSAERGLARRNGNSTPPEAEAGARTPLARQSQRPSSPLLAIATRRMRRRRAHFIPAGRL